MPTRKNGSRVYITCALKGSRDYVPRTRTPLRKTIGSRGTGCLTKSPPSHGTHCLSLAQVPFAEKVHTLTRKTPDLTLD